MKQKLLNSFRLKATLLVAVLCALFTGTAWADETYTIGWGTASGSTSTNFTATSGSVSNILSFEAAKESSANNPAYNSTSNELRLYYHSSGNGGSVTLTPASGITITGFVMTTSTSPSVEYKVDGGSATSVSASNNTYSVSNISATSSLKIQNVNTSNTQLRIKTIQISYTIAAPSYTITAASNNNSWGTVSLSGSVITASPKAGYTYADPAYTVSSGTATVTQNGNEFTVTPSSDCTVTINFEALPTYTVTFSDGGSVTQASGGASVTLPSRSAIGSYTFAGWSETNVPSETTTAPSSIIPAGSYTPTGTITLYPVYTKTVAGGGTTHETASVTISDYATTNDWANSTKNTSVTLDANVTASTYDKTGTGNTGKYYSSDNTWRFYQNEEAKVTISTTSGELTSVTFTFTVSNTGTLNYNSSAITSGTAVNVSGTSAEFTVGNSGSATNGQVKITDISVNYDVTGGGTTYYWSAPVAAAVETPVISVADNPFLFSTTATITCATEGATIKYSYDNSAWNDYSSALTITETTTIYAKAIKDENESAVAQITATKTLATPTVTVSGDLTLDLDGGTNVSAGTLTAAVTYEENAVAGATVTWSSNNTAVATIDASTGAVTIKATGEVTFTATYAGNGDYAEATGTKTVTVVDSNAPGTTQQNPYTVAQALTAIQALPNNNATSEKYYVSGIVSAFYGDATGITSSSSKRYYISDDGTTTTQLLVYNGKGLNNETFSSDDDLLIGDRVIIYGAIQNYQGNTPEMASSNYIVSRTTKTANDLTKTDDITLSESDLTATANATDYFTTSSTGALSYEIADENVATVSDAGVVTPVGAGTTTLTVSQAADATYKAGSLEITVTVAAASLNSTTIVANASGSTTYGTNKEEDYMIDDTYDGTVTAVSGNPAVATVAITQHTAGEGTFTITPVAVGTAVITISAPATATCEAADDVTYTITVTAPAGQTTAVAAPTTLFNETFAKCESTGGNDTDGWSGTIANGTLTDGTNTDNSGWTFANGNAANGCAKFGTGSKKGSATTPAIGTAGTLILSFKAAAWNGSSEGTTLNLSVSEGSIDKSSVTMTKGAFNTFTATITNATAETTITFEAQNASNNRFFLDDVKVTTEGAELTVKLNASGYATYCSLYPLDFSGATDYSAWQITDANSTTGEITFSQITGDVKGGTGLFLMGTAGATVTLTSEDSDNELSGNLLYGTTAPTYVTTDQYYGLSANQFKKVNAGTVPAGKALLPAIGVSSVKAFTFVFNGADGITETRQVSREEVESIFNLGGQRLSKMQRGVNIVNGKKVLVK